METKKCKVCGETLKPGMAKCVNPKCLTWNVPELTIANTDESTILLSDARLTYVERIETGLVDEIFGGGKGVAKTSVNLLGGEPGAGKTTLCLQLCDIFAERTAKESVYIANEQDATELKDTADRLGLRNLNRIRIVKAMGGVAHDIGDLLLRYKPGAIFLDSITNWVGEDLELAVTICKRLKVYSVELKAPSFVINQITKGGDHAGLMKMQHAVDLTAIFSIMEDDEGEPRVLHSLKNRFGPAPEEQFFQMTEKGLIEVSEEFEEKDR